MTLKTMKLAVLALSSLGVLGGCGPEVQGSDGEAGTTPDGTPADTMSAEQNLCTNPSGCIGSPTPLWRRTGITGPCFNGQTVDKGYVSLNATSYIVGRYYKKSWDDAGGYYHYNRYVQASYNQAHKYWVCEGGGFTEYGYGSNAVHRHQDYISTCFGAACQALFTSYSGWYGGHTCNH